jgi:hypothetical protein
MKIDIGYRIEFVKVIEQEEKYKRLSKLISSVGLPPNRNWIPVSVKVQPEDSNHTIT